MKNAARNREEDIKAEGVMVVEETKKPPETARTCFLLFPVSSLHPFRSHHSPLPSPDTGVDGFHHTPRFVDIEQFLLLTSV